MTRKNHPWLDAYRAPGIVAAGASGASAYNARRGFGKISSH